jgi:hypothetical protein
MYLGTCERYKEAGHPLRPGVGNLHSRKARLDDASVWLARKEVNAKCRQEDGSSDMTMLPVILQ